MVTHFPSSLLWYASTGRRQKQKSGTTRKKIINLFSISAFTTINWARIWEYGKAGIAVSENAIEAGTVNRFLPFISLPSRNRSTTTTTMATTTTIALLKTVPALSHKSFIFYFCTTLQLPCKISQTVHKGADTVQDRRFATLLIVLGSKLNILLYIFEAFFMLAALKYELHSFLHTFRRMF